MINIGVSEVDFFVVVKLVWQHISDSIAGMTAQSAWITGIHVKILLLLQSYQTWRSKDVGIFQLLVDVIEVLDLLSIFGSAQRMFPSEENVIPFFILKLVESEHGIHLITEHTKVVQMRIWELELRLTFGCQQNFSERQSSGENSLIESFETFDGIYEFSVGDQIIFVVICGGLIRVIALSLFVWGSITGSLFVLPLQFHVPS